MGTVRHIAGWAVLAWAVAPLLAAQHPGANPGANRPAAAAQPKAAAKPAAKPDTKAAPPAAVPAEDPAVEAILAVTSTTPSSWLRSAKVLVELQRPELAKTFLRKVLDAKLNDSQWMALAEEFGSGLFVQWQTNSALAPEGKRLAEALISVRHRLTTDSKRLAEAIRNLQDPKSEVRTAALLQLQAARRDAVSPLLLVLADPQRAPEHPAVRSALILLGREALEPLLATLDSADSRLRVEVIRILAGMGAAEVAIHLVAPAFCELDGGEVRQAAEAALQQLLGVKPQRPEAAALLAAQALRYFDRQQPVGADETGQSELWSWDSQQKKLLSRQLPAEQAARVLAARWARQAQALLPQDATLRLLYWATLLEQAAGEQGLDQPWNPAPGTPAAQISQLDCGTLENVLAYAMAHRRPAAATLAARLLGANPQAEALLYRGSHPAPLVQAAGHADRRLRLAAVEALVQLKPRQAFSGASILPESLRFLIATRGKPRILIGTSQTNWGRTLAGMLAGSYEADLVPLGREVLRLAQQSPDYEVVLLDVGIDQPPAEFVLQQLRRDNRAAGLAVGVLAAAERIDRAEQLVRDDPRAEAFCRPGDEQALRWQLQRLLALAADPPRPGERQRQASQALDRLAELLACPAQCKLYDWSGMEQAVQTALSVPALAQKAVGILGTFGTPHCQQNLVDLASQPTTPLPLRQAAVTAFSQAVQRRGILLTAAQIGQQYDRYQQSLGDAAQREPADAASQKILGQLLDVLEASGKRLRQPKPATAQTHSAH